ncbi:MAG: FHA domain-containing protein [Planctomycetota bacterium]|nr:FHA domain-containing protein [Planctomycetota bacterium]
MATLIVVTGIAGTERFDVDQGVTIGRAPHNSIPLPDVRGVSRDHAKVWRIGPAKYALADLGSTNGVLHNNDKVKRADLDDGDEIQIGDAVFRFELSADEKPKPKFRPKEEDSREDFAALLRGDKTRDDRPVATQVEGHAAIQMKERLLQYNHKTKSDNQLGWDVSQTAGVTGWLLRIGILGIVAALFYLAMKVFN